VAFLARLGGRLSETYVFRVVKADTESQAGNYAGGLAFTAFVSMFPLMLGLLAIVGFAVSDPHARAQFETALLSFFPRDASRGLHDALSGIHRFSGVFGIIGLVGFVWTGSSLFTGMEWTLGRMTGVGQRDFLRQRAMALVMTVVFVVVVVLVVGVNSALALAGGLPVLGPALGFAVWTAFMLVVYRAVPERTYRLIQLLRGAVLAGALMELLTLIWPLYTRLVHGFNTYGAIFALFFVLATWLYFWAQFTLLGAVVNRMRAGEPSVPGLIARPRR